MQLENLKHGSAWALQITQPTEHVGLVAAWLNDDGRGMVQLGASEPSRWLQVRQIDDVLAVSIHSGIAQQLSGNLLRVVAQNRELRRLSGKQEPALFARIHTASESLLKVEEPSDWIGVAHFPVAKDTASLEYEDDLWNVTITEELAELLALSILSRLGQLSVTETWSERKFLLHFAMPTELPKREDSVVHEDELAFDQENMRGLLAAACRLIANRSDAKFEVYAFSRVPWKVDVETDLAAVLEQLPGVLQQLRSGTDAVLDFQDVERSLHLHYHAPALTIECQSRNKSWAPQWSSQRTAPQNIVDMLRELGASFYGLLLQIGPRLAAHPQLQKWNAAMAPI